ncbi:hypothetical protein HK14_06660 [Acetobacter cibinongensis]|uniref:Uncharacterized protein n=1 Tax=Acetobacter cibinongensis TaxID=146475 RepID=A0A1Z5YUF5_9PROT|nr:hypothetical protein HK14_06660 [Acetobacter cibinongensis]
MEGRPQAHSTALCGRSGRRSLATIARLPRTRYDTQNIIFYFKKLRPFMDSASFAEQKAHGRLFLQIMPLQAVRAGRG